MTARAAWLGVAATTVAVGVLYMAIFAVPPLIASVFTGEQGLSNSDAGLLMTAYLAAYAAASLPAGALADRFGPARLIALGLVVCGAASLAFAETTDFGVQLVLRCLVGVAAAIVYTPSISLIRSLLSAERAHAGVGWFSAGLSLGITLAFWATPRLEDAIGWQWPFRIYGIACLVALAALVLVPREGWRSRAAHIGNPLAGMLPLFRNGVLVVVAIGLFVGMAVLYGVLTWTPPFLDSVAGFSADGLSNAALLIAFACIPASLAGGWAATRLGRPAAVVGGSLLLAVPIALYWVVSPDQGALLTTLAVLATWGATAAVIPLFALPSITVEPRLAGTATGFAVTIGMGGAILSTYLGGWIVDWSSWGVAFFVFAMIAAAGALVLAPALGAQLRGGREPVAAPAD